MSRLALSRGHGSTIWVTLSLATALPPLSAMLSRRSRYSEQPASVANTAASASVTLNLLNGRIGNPLWHIEHVPGERLIASSGDALHGWRKRARLFPRHLHLAHQEEIRVVRRQRVVGRC